MKQVIVLSVVLAASLVGSYMTWTSPDTEADTEAAVVVYNAAETDLQKVSWNSESLVVVVERRSDDHGEYMWIEVTEHKEVPVGGEPNPMEMMMDMEMGDDHGDHGDHDHGNEAKDGEDAEGGEDGEGDEAGEEEEPEMVMQTTVTAFGGNEAASDLWANFAPLEALRELTLAADASQEVFGFEEPTATLAVQRRSGALELTVGGETYGSKDRYIGRDGRVFLVDDATLRPLQFAKTRLVERRLHPLTEAETEKVSVQAATGNVTFVQANRDDRSKAFWATEDEADTENSTAGIWLGKLFRMRVKGYVDEASLENPLQSMFTFSVTGEGDTWGVEVLQDNSGDEVEYYARPQFTRGLVSMTKSLAAEAIDDLETIFE